MNQLEKRAQLAVKEIANDYDKEIQKQLNNLFNYNHGSQYILQKDLYKCKMEDSKQEVKEFQKILTDEICTKLLVEESDLKYSEIGRLICALGDLLFYRKGIDERLKNISDSKVNFCLLTYHQTDSLNLQNGNEKYINMLEVLDE